MSNENETVYFSEFGGRWADARSNRKAGYDSPDPVRPDDMTDEEYLFMKKFVAHHEGGPHPDSPDANGNLKEICTPSNLGSRQQSNVQGWKSNFLAVTRRPGQAGAFR